jgi:S1-C subfamily serine protease
MDYILSWEGRWSASIISNNGLILTNNHVVSDDNGKAQTSFSICMSLLRHRLAQFVIEPHLLIAKDEQKDIALLRIDPTDIRGNNVNYTSFSYGIDLDYAYKILILKIKHLLSDILR